MRFHRFIPFIALNVINSVSVRGLIDKMRGWLIWALKSVKLMRDISPKRRLTIFNTSSFMRIIRFKSSSCQFHHIFINFCSKHNRSQEKKKNPKCREKLVHKRCALVQFLLICMYSIVRHRVVICSSGSFFSVAFFLVIQFRKLNEILSKWPQKKWTFQHRDRRKFKFMKCSRSRPIKTLASFHFDENRAN